MPLMLVISYEPEKNRLQVLEAPKDKMTCFGMLAMAQAMLGQTMKAQATVQLPTDLIRGGG